MKHPGTKFLLGAICPNTYMSVDRNVSVKYANLSICENDSEEFSLDIINPQLQEVKQFIDVSEKQIRNNWQRNTYTIVVFDIDKFSAINDNYGHPAGDELLLGITRKLEARIQKPNRYCRLCSDNFAIFLENYSEIDIALMVIHFTEEISNEYAQFQPKLSFGISRTEGKYVNVPYLCNRAFLAKSTIKGKAQLLANYDEVLTSGQ